MPVSIQSRGLLEALLAVLAIWLIARTLPDYILIIYMVFFQADTASQLDQLFAGQTARVMTNVALGAVLIWQRRRISSWLISGTESVDMSATTVVSLGSALLGIYFTAEGFISLGTYLIYTPEQQSMARGVPWGGSASVAIGLILFITSGKIGKLWALLRGRGGNAV